MCSFLSRSLHFPNYFQGNGYESDIAIDDINLTQGGSCAYFASTTRPSVTPPTAAYDCDFEDNSFCVWRVETSDKPWKISSGQTAVYGKAPLADHTRQNVYGRYAYVPVEATGGPIYPTSISFNALPKAFAFCLDFWYQSFVSSDTTLNVYVQNGSLTAVNVWRRPGTTQRDQWTHASVNIGTVLTQMTITISGRKKNSPLSIYIGLFMK